MEKSKLREKVMRDWQSRLVQSGLRVAAYNNDGARCFRVPVIELQAQAVERIWPWTSSHIRLSHPGWTAADPLYRRAARVAVRAVYALGYATGEVELTLDGGGKSAIHAVRTGLSLSTSSTGTAHHLETERLPNQREASVPDRHAVHAYNDAPDVPAIYAGQQPLLIGADPEFVLMRADGRLVPAGRYLSPGAAAGSDAMAVRRRITQLAAELRPAPAATPAELCVNIRRLLGQAARRIREPGLHWLAGGRPVPGVALGGHVHLSGVPLTERLLRVLDSCVALPLSLLEQPASVERRPRYGWLGDFRHQPHGGFEYRTLPSWLVSPPAARAVFGLVLLAARELEAICSACAWLPAEDDMLISAYYAGDRATLREGMLPFMEQLMSLSGYGAFEPDIAPLFSAIREGRMWDEGRDIRQAWGLKPS